MTPNEIANHPAVYPWVALLGQDEIDLSSILDDPRSVWLDYEGGGFLFQHMYEATYQVHTLFVPGEGSPLKAARDAAQKMFLETPCLEILTMVPDRNTRADKLTRAMGFVKEFHRDNAFNGVEGVQGATFYALRYHDWIKGQDWLTGYGEWFHRQIEAQGFHPDHAEDPAHDRAVGACTRMILGGQLHKAVWLYNRWALFAGYAPIQILGEVPPTLDIRTCIVRLDGGTIICQSGQDSD